VVSSPKNRLTFYAENVEQARMLLRTRKNRLLLLDAIKSTSWPFLFPVERIQISRGKLWDARWVARFRPLNRTKKEWNLRIRVVLAA